MDEAILHYTLQRLVDRQVRAVESAVKLESVAVGHACDEVADGAHLQHLRRILANRAEIIWQQTCPTFLRKSLEYIFHNILAAIFDNLQHGRSNDPVVGD